MRSSVIIGIAVVGLVAAAAIDSLNRPPAPKKPEHGLIYFTATLPSSQTAATTVNVYPVGAMMRCELIVQDRVVASMIRMPGGQCSFAELASTCPGYGSIGGCGTTLMPNRPSTAAGFDRH